MWALSSSRSRMGLRIKAYDEHMEIAMTWTLFLPTANPMKS